MKRTPLKRKTRLRPVSSKRRKDMATYSVLRRELLRLHPACEVCGARASTDCHHKEKRGKNYLNADSFMAVCRECHDSIHRNPAWARETGYLT